MQWKTDSLIYHSSQLQAVLVFYIITNFHFSKNSGRNDYEDNCFIKHTDRAVPSHKMAERLRSLTLYLVSRLAMER